MSGSCHPPIRPRARTSSSPSWRPIVGDPLPYGIAKNRASIEALIKYVHQQGMLKKSYAVSDFFVDPEAA